MCMCGYVKCFFVYAYIIHMCVCVLIQLSDRCLKERDNHVKEIAFSMRYWMTEYNFHEKKPYFTVIET